MANIKFDFYTISKLIDAIDDASLEDCKRNLNTCIEWKNRYDIASTKRKLWSTFELLIREQIKKY